MPRLLGITYDFDKALPKNNEKCLIKPMESKKHIGRKLKELAEEKGYSPADIARLFGVKPPSVYDWYEHGRIAKRHYPKLVDWSGLPIDWWLDIEQLRNTAEVSQITAVQEKQSVYSVKTKDHWPFLSFDHDAWMRLSKDDRDHWEAMILLAISRAKQTNVSNGPALHSTL